MDSSIAAVCNLVEIISSVSRDASNELKKLPQEPSVDLARNIFVYMRAYYGKAHSLAEYISGEESYAIKSLEEDNIEEFHDFLSEVLLKSEVCQKDLRDLALFIEKERPSLLQQDSKVQERVKGAGILKKAGYGAAIVGVGLCGCGLIGGLAGIEEVASFILIVIGLAFTSAGVFAIVKGSSALSINQDVIEAFDKTALAIEQLRLFVKKNENKLDGASRRLRSTMNFKISQSQIGRPAKNSIIQSIREMAEHARGLKEYCQPFIEADTLEHFIAHHTNKTVLYM